MASGKSNGSGAGFSPDHFVEKKRQEVAEITLKRNPETAKMHPRKRALALNVVAHPERTLKENAVDAGYHPDYPVALLKKQIAGSLGQTLAEAGVLEIDIGRAIAQGLSATRTIPVRKIKRDKNTGKICGESIALEQVPDHRTRALFVKLACLLGGYFAPIKFQGVVEQRHKVYAILDQIPPDQLEREVRAAKESGDDVEFEVLEDTGT